MEPSVEAKISMEEIDDPEMQRAVQASLNEPSVDLVAEAFRFGEQTSRPRKIKAYSSNIKTGQTEGVRKVYDAKNGDEIFIILCPKCSKSPKNLMNSSLPKPIFKLTIDLLDIAVEANSDDELVVTYSLVSSGEVFQRKILTPKKLRQNLADIIFGRPGTLTTQLTTTKGSLGFAKHEKIGQEELERHLKYYLALL